MKHRNGGSTGPDDREGGSSAAPRSAAVVRVHELRSSASRRAVWLGRVVAVGVAVVLGCAVAGCGRQRVLPPEATRVQESVATDVLRLSFSADPMQLNPILPLEEYGRLVANLVHAAPLRRTPTGFEPDLWEDVSIATDGSDRLVVSGRWRAGLTWHDGQPFSPHDFAFTLEAMRQAANLSPYRELAEQVVSAETGDDGRCTVVFARNDLSLLEVLQAGVLPAHLLAMQHLPDAQYRVASGVAVALASSTPASIASASAGPAVPVGEPGGAASGTVAGAPAGASPSAGVVEGAAGDGRDEKDGKDLRRYSLDPVGLGPFSLARQRDNGYLLLRRHEAYHRVASDGGRLPRCREILIEYHFDPEPVIHGLRQGRLDAAWIPSELTPGFETFRIDRVRLLRVPNPSYWLLGLNSKRAPFDRIEIRQAFSRLIDRDALKKTIPYAGRMLAAPWAPAGVDGGTAAAPGAGTASSVVQPGVGGVASGAGGVESPGGATGGPALGRSSAVLPPLPPAEFRQLLLAAGATDADGDGRLEFGGQAMSLTILVNEDNLLRKQVAESLVPRLQAAGLTASVEALPWADLVEGRLTAGRFEAFLMAFSAPAHGDWRNLWHSQPPVQPSLNFTGVSDPQLDQMLGALGRWPPPADPGAALTAIVDRLATLAPGAFLFVPDDVLVVRDGVTGVATDRPLWDLDLTEWARTAP